MKSPAQMHTIQIDITNACPNSCSNCTRFCGHHKKPYFMEFAFFQAAVDSLQEFPGVVGMMGGEPTLHPEFEKFARYLRASRLPEGEQLLRKPVADMSIAMHGQLTQRHHKGCGLCSTLGAGYYRHFETIADTFGYQILNDHKNPCKHQGLLVSWKDCGLSEAAFLKKRDKCWIQNNWSASITPKGAFFCEVAGALDMLFDGPGGWDITDNAWWKRTPEEFGAQLQWCDICGAALDTPARPSYDGRDDVSPALLRLLEEQGSPKIAKKHYVLFDGTASGATFDAGDTYMKGFEWERLSQGQSSLYPQKIFLAESGMTLAACMAAQSTDWVFVPLSGKCSPPSSLNSVIFNPGCFYQYADKWAFFNMRAHALRGADTGRALRTLPELYPQEKIIPLHWMDIIPVSSWKYLLVRRLRNVFRHN